jgi:hypothetical protein
MTPESAATAPAKEIGPDWANDRPARTRKELDPSLSRGLSLCDDQQPIFGFENYRLRLQVDGAVHVPELFSRTVSGAEERLSAWLSPTLEVVLQVRPLKKGAFLLAVSLKNQGAAPCRLEAAAFGQFGSEALFHPSDSHVLGWSLRFAHTGNLRRESYPFCTTDYPYLRPLPVEPGRWGDTEDQPFPALFILNDENRRGLVVGAASQKTSVPVFALCRRPLFRPDAFAQFEVRWDFPQCAGLIIPAGGALPLDTLYLQLTRERTVSAAFEDYLDHLARENVLRGHVTPLTREAVHCTWNYGVFNDQREEPLLKTARFIAREMPAIKWFLVDDGYLGRAPRRRCFLNCFYPDPGPNFEAGDWPRGLRAFTDEVRGLGLRPAIWWTPTVKLPCPLHDDHPDWFLRRKDGSLYLIGEDSAYLDYSHPEALAFLDRTLGLILREWGFEGCKIDFWSQNFETRDAVLSAPGRTSVEARRLFFQTVRRHLPEDGFIMSCIAMGMGNPFLGEFVDTYRCSMDISDGLWHDQVRSARWSLPNLGFGGRRTFLLNMDSAGINPQVPENETIFRLTWCFITMGVIETGGRMEQLAPGHLQMMQRLLSRCDRGHPCRCSDTRAFTGEPLPESLYVDYPPDSVSARAGVRQSVAFLNWTEEPRAVSLDRRRLGQPGPVMVTDFWTGATDRWTQNFATIELEPRSARLFDVNW